jgi:hypothetical protein
MNRENFEKLLRATREAPADLFNMRMFVGAPTACGTPACLLGNYALREDLQNAFVADAETATNMGRIFDAGSGLRVWCNDPSVCDHFGITEEQADRLFAANGCNNAGTDHDKAIAYVEHFMTTGETPYDACDDDDECEDDECEDDEDDE